MAKEKKTASEKEHELIEEVVKRLKQAVRADSHNRDAAIEDLKFTNGEQWNGAERKRRSDKGRPALQINLLPKYIEQVVGDMLHNTPSIKMHPVDSLGDINIAKIRQGIISQIEYQSNSKGIYGYASRQMVTCGYGAWRVLTRYAEENPFIQEIYLESIRNPFLVYMDPSAKDQNYADAKWGILLEKMPKDEFEERYPDAELPFDQFNSGRGLTDENWYNSESITVAEYFKRDTKTVNMVQLDDGRVMSKDEFKEIHKEWKVKFDKILDDIEFGSIEPPKAPMSAGLPQQGQPPTGAPPMTGMPPQQAGGSPPHPMGMPAPPAMSSPSPVQGGMGAGPKQMPPPPAMSQVPPSQSKPVEPEPKIALERDTERTIIKHWIVTCCEILEGEAEGNIVAGKYIPLVLLKGKELNIEGKNYVYSLIRHAKDPQKLVNYWNTAAAEVIALAPKAPWVGTAKQFEGYETDYAGANVENNPFLKYNADPDAQGPPQRQGAGQPPVAIFEQIRRGEENLKSVIGMFNADVGAPGSEQTGAAVTARQKPGDIATFEFMENLARAVMFTGKVINEMIPEIYDTERDVRIRNIDESDSFVPVNTTLGAAKKAMDKDPERFKGIDAVKFHDMFAKEGKDAKFNDVTCGKYDVVVTTGPSYATQRQESAQHLLQLVQAMPQHMAIGADLLVESMDFKGADELSARLRKQLPPQLVKPRPGEAPPAPPQPPPAVLLAQAKLETEKLKGEMAKSKVQLEQAKIQKEMGKQPEPPNPKDQSDAQLAHLKLQVEQLKMQHDKEKMNGEKQAADLRTQLEQVRLDHELEKQRLTIQLQREAHQAKMQEMELSRAIKIEEARNKPTPPKRKE